MSMQARMWLSNQTKDKDKMGNRCWVYVTSAAGLFCLSSFMVDRRCPSTAPKFTNYRWNYREHQFFVVKITSSQQRKQLAGLGSGLCACAHQFWPGAVAVPDCLWTTGDKRINFQNRKCIGLWAKQVSKGIYLWDREMQWQVHQMTAAPSPGVATWAEWNLPVRAATGRTATSPRNSRGTVTQG